MDTLTKRFHREVFEPYVQLLKAKYRIHPMFDHARREWERRLTAAELINGPYLEQSQIYQDGDPVSELALHEKTKLTIKAKLGARNLWKHQTDAIRLILSGSNAIVATGTSSGKTLCYQLPILDDLIRQPAPGLRAVIVYPLNALVNDQLTEWEWLLSRHREITFARFTGQTPSNQEEYIALLQDAYRQELADSGLTQQEVQRRVREQTERRLARDIPNRLNHRDAIRKQPPNILITNFSMLEYLLERPVDAPVFQNSRLKFLVLDEAHAYRGVQATEIGFLIRRLKDRLALTQVTCIATSATLGKEGDIKSRAKVRKFACDLFNEPFDDPNPIAGTSARIPPPPTPSRTSPDIYLAAVAQIRQTPKSSIGRIFEGNENESIAETLARDGNLYQLRTEVLKKPILLQDAAEKLWTKKQNNVEALESLLEIVATAKQLDTEQDILPTRLHYFVRAQDGLHICLNRRCPGRNDNKPTFFVTRNNGKETPEGLCPSCFATGQTSRLVEVVTCRKCGYLFGALQDLGPKRAQAPESDDTVSPYFDSFSTELGWMADSYWSYFSTEQELPYPSQKDDDDETDDADDLIAKPAELQWCSSCGKKSDNGAGDNCTCEKPQLRKIQIFHRQCPHTGKSKDIDNLYRQEKSLLTRCPNCLARNGSGLEPLHRFQESSDSMGLAMAVPFAHFQVRPLKEGEPDVRKLLCFTDHRQRAAAFPSLLEEETFTYDMGRKIVQILKTQNRAMDLVSIGEALADLADSSSANYDPNLFLPVSRMPDDEPDARTKRNLWLAEVFAYFAIPDSARESAEDFGLVTVEYRLDSEEKRALYNAIGNTQITEKCAIEIVQSLLRYMRERKAFTLPKGRVEVTAPAFGRVTADVAYARQHGGVKNTNGWLPRPGRDNVITDYLCRAFKIDKADAWNVADRIWGCLTKSGLLIEYRGRWKLDHEKIEVRTASECYVCNRCGVISSYIGAGNCFKKACTGTFEKRVQSKGEENIVARWVSGTEPPRYYTLKSEEHTAQINKELAKTIEDAFRGEGINLLSSTTTFEMGINIGDLQKVLLRNAPPTSASYLQRIGRAGRGNDKNAVCVTLCSRSKYDSDVWNDPPRLMSGEVRTPTVFTENRVIAQRHFNAILFAKFLRTKILDEQALGEPAQQIRLEAFIALEARSGIPESWIKVRPANIFLDYAAWGSTQSEQTIFNTDAGKNVSSVLTDFQHATESSINKYSKIITAIGEELAALQKERLRAFEMGYRTSDVEQAIQNLLGSNVIDALARRGFLPRYAFPLDVVTLETGRTRWSRASDVDLSRDRGIAIAEFAPGAQVIAHKKVYTSAGLYIVSKLDKPTRQWYSECPSCRQIRTAQTKEELIGPCTVCQRTITPHSIKPFVAPNAFSVRVDEQRPSERYRRNTFIRQRQAITHFIDYLDDSSFQDKGKYQIALKEAGKLFRYNLGPEQKGFMLCQTCGCSEPLRGYKPGKRHKRLRPIAGVLECPDDHPWTSGLAFGHEFQSFCLIVRPLAGAASVASLAFALQGGLCRLLEIELSDIGVSWRWLSKERDKSRTEIILYDQTPGGAGFVREGYNRWQSVQEWAQRLCLDCTCETACYDCLKSYSNQTYHDELDRQSVLTFFSAST